MEIIEQTAILNAYASEINEICMHFRTLCLLLTKPRAIVWSHESAHCKMNKPRYSLTQWVHSSPLFKQSE